MLFKPPESLLKDRDELKRLAGPYIGKATDGDLLRLIRHVYSNGGDLDLCLSALLLLKRPKWVVEIVGALPTKGVVRDRG